MLGIVISAWGSDRFEGFIFLVLITYFPWILSFLVERKDWILWIGLSIIIVTLSIIVLGRLNYDNTYRVLTVFAIMFAALGYAYDVIAYNKKEERDQKYRKYIETIKEM